LLILPFDFIALCLEFKTRDYEYNCSGRRWAANARAGFDLLQATMPGVFVIWVLPNNEYSFVAVSASNVFQYEYLRQVRGV